MNARSTDECTPSWLEKVWMEVQAEIDYETRHPQSASWPCLYPDCVGGPDTACHAKTAPCK